MGKTAVIYQSKYGGAKQYAKWIAAALDAELFAFDSKPPANIADYTTVIYGAGLYAGSINGFSRFREWFQKYPEKRFILFTVSLSSPDSKETMKCVIDRAFNAEMHARIKVFHLRGGIDYARLSFIHRAMMKIMMILLLRKKPESLTEDEKGFISVYGKSVSFADEAAIEPLLTYASSIGADC